MDRYKYKSIWMKKALVGSAAGFFLLLIFYLLLLRPAIEREVSAEAELNSARKQYSDLSAITEDIAGYREEQSEVEDLLSEFVNYILFTDTKTLSGQISEIADGAGVNIGEVKNRGNYYTESGYRKQLWEMSFKEDSQTLLNFLRDLESYRNFIAVEELEIESGGFEKSHKTDIVIYNVTDIDIELIEEDEVTFDTDSFLELAEIVFKNAENLVVMAEYDPVDVSLTRDSLYYEDTLFTQVVEEEPPPAAAPAPTPPRLQLGGIFWDETNPVAIINGEMVHEGESIEGAEVERISRRNVLLKWRTEYIRLEMD